MTEINSFRGLEIPSSWRMNRKKEEGELKPGTVVGYAPPIRYDRKDPSQVIIWDGSDCIAQSAKRRRK